MIGSARYAREHVIVSETQSVDQAMRRISRLIHLALVLSVVLTAGCSSTRVAEGSLDAVMIAEINERGLAERATIFTYPLTGPTRRSYVGDNLRIATDSASWIDPSTMALVAVPVRSVGRVRFVSHWDGAGKGFLYGSMGGAAAGVVMGVTSWEPGHHNLTSSAGDHAMYSAAFLGGACGVIGLIGGAISGAETNYEFRSP